MAFKLLSKVPDILMFLLNRVLRVRGRTSTSQATWHTSMASGEACKRKSTLLLLTDGLRSCTVLRLKLFNTTTRSDTLPSTAKRSEIALENLPSVHLREIPWSEPWTFGGVLECIWRVATANLWSASQNSAIRETLQFWRIFLRITPVDTVVVKDFPANANKVHLFSYISLSSMRAECWHHDPEVHKV